MSAFLPRTGFNSPSLVRFLAGLAVAEVPESKQSLAERLGHWLDLGDAIALSGALAVVRPSPDAPAAAAGAGAVAELAELVELARVRDELTAAIAADAAAGGGQTGRPRVPLPADGPAGSADFLPYRRYCLARQRDMEAALVPLRARLRAALAARSPALASLAAIDAALEKALAERERVQLGALPFLLEKHFERLRRNAAERGDAGDPGGWLARFRRDLRQALLAELDLRLQPLLGLAAATAGR